MRIQCLSINSEDNLSGVPKWEYSLAFAFLQAYYMHSPYYDTTEFIPAVYYEGSSTDSIVRDVLEQHPDLLAISSYIWNIEKVEKIVESLRQAASGMAIILGGPEFGSGGEAFLANHPNATALVVGEGEITFRAFLDCMHESRMDDTSLGSIKGLVFRSQAGEVRTNEPRPVNKYLDSIPSPYLTGVVPVDMLKGKLVAIETQRGCVNDCGYCNYQKGTKGLRFFDLDRVLKELELILTQEPKQLYLMDPTFNSNPNRVKAILECIVRCNNKTVLNAEMLPDILNHEVISLSKKAGMRTVEVGIQSLNPEAIRIMKRYRNEERLFQNIHLAVKEGLYLIPQIIYGLPGEDMKSFFEGFDKVYDLPTQEFDLLRLLLLPQTRYRYEALEHGIRYKKTAPYEIIESKTFSAEDINHLEKFRKLVLATQPMKLEVARFDNDLGLKHHEVFEEAMELISWENEDFQWPIHTLADRDNAIQAINVFYDFFLQRIAGHDDKFLRKKLKKSKKRAQFMLAARYMTLPKES